MGALQCRFEEVALFYLEEKMKQKKWAICILLMLLVITLCIAVACSQNNDPTATIPHSHTFSDKWTSNGAYHWHAATCGHEIESGKATHTYTSWKTIKEPSCETMGIKERTCTVCEYKEQEKISITAHVYSDKWSYDEQDHYHVATCGHEFEKDRQAHSLSSWLTIKEPSCETVGVKEKSCSVCEYYVQEEIAATGHNYANTWSSDEQVHYHAATCGHQSEADRADHTFFGSTCTVCNYTVDYTPGMTYRQVNFGTGLSYELIGIGTASGGKIVVPQIYNGYPVISISSTAFSNCIAVKEIVIPDSVINIPNGAFAGCTSLEKLTVPFINGMAGAMFGSATYSCTDYNMFLPVNTKEFSWKINGQTIYGMRPVDGTDWILNETWVTVNGKQMLYQEEVVSPSAWTTYNLYISGVKADSWEIPSRANCNVYGVPQTLELLTITNQLISPYDPAFYNLPCKVNILQKYEIQSLEVTGESSVYIDEFDFSNYTLKVTRVNGDVDTYALTSDNFSASDNQKFKTVGSHTVTAKFGNKTVSFEIEIKEHTFDETVFESQTFYYNGSAHYLEVTGVPEGTNIQYTNNGQSAIGEYTVTVTLSKQYYQSLTLTAKLSIMNSNFIITYILGKEGASNENPTHYNYYDETITLNNAELPMYEFLGWYLEKNYITQITSIKQNSQENIILYAKWQTIFSVNGNIITGFTIYGQENYPDEIVIPLRIDNAIVTSIGDEAFANCANIKSIIFENGSQLSYIGASAFNGCINIDSVIISDIVTWCNIEFGNYSANPLYYASNLYLSEDLLTNIIIPSNVKSIKNYAFYNYAKLETIAFDSAIALQSIGDFAFYGCTNLINISIPMGISSIGNSAFYECRGLINVSIPSSICSIGSRAFCRCSRLVEVIFENNSQLTTISDSLFFECNSLANIVIPNNVTYIGDRAFNRCYSLISITIPEKVTHIGDYVFNYNSKLSTVYWNASNCTKVGDYTYDNRTIFQGCYDLTNIIFGDNVKNIPAYAFYNCTRIINVELPSNLTSIGSHAFAGCEKLITIVIPSSVTSIGDTVFYCCSNLQSVVFQNGSKISSIANYLFYHCSKLESINIPKTVRSIGAYAFNSKNLKTIYYEGELFDWQKISINTGNSYLDDATLCYLSEDEPQLNEDGTDYNDNYWHWIDGTPVIWKKES